MSKLKISEHEFKIRLLELKKGTLSEKEAYRLKSLKEQLMLQKKLGWVENKVVPVKLLDKLVATVKSSASKSKLVGL